MSATPSPSKRPRGPSHTAGSSSVAGYRFAQHGGGGGGPSTPYIPGSDTASPFHPSFHQAASSSNPNARPTPPPASALAGLGMSPMDSFSPNNPATGYTPYSTTSPAYLPPNAASPISTALFHGNKILSHIQAPSPYPSQHPSRFPPGNFPPPYTRNHPPNIGAQPQSAPLGSTQQPPKVPQRGSPEYLRASLQFLQTTLLDRLEKDAEEYFDSVESSIHPTADSRIVMSKAKAFQGSLDSVLTFVEKNGLASIPCIDPAEETSKETSDSISQPADSTATAATATDSKKAEQDPTNSSQPQTQDSTSQAANRTENSSQSNEQLQTQLKAQIDSLQTTAKTMFLRRQRLRESGGIVAGILAD